LKPYQAHHKKGNPYVTLLPVSDFAAVLIILWQRTFGNGVSCKTGAGRADVAVQAVPVSRCPVFFIFPLFSDPFKFCALQKFIPSPNAGRRL
jgi:hypothetical protein